jgi:hypothetical protein
VYEITEGIVTIKNNCFSKQYIVNLRETQFAIYSVASIEAIFRIMSEDYTERKKS